MNKTVNTVLWVVLFLFLLPSSLAIASWNSLPGSRLFTTKLFMEQALVVVVPNEQVKGNLQITYTERRLSEATRMIADQTSVRGLSYLDNQVDKTRDAILEAKDPVVKRELAQKYVARLRDVNTQLEQQKQIMQSYTPSGAAPVVPRAPASTQTPKPTPTPAHYIPPPVIPPSGVGIVSTRTPAPTPFVPPVETPSENIEDSISSTQENIQETIEEIENEIGESPGNSEFGHGQGQGQGQGRGNQDGNQGQKQGHN